MTGDCLATETLREHVAAVIAGRVSPDRTRAALLGSARWRVQRELWRREVGGRAAYPDGGARPPVH